METETEYPTPWKRIVRQLGIGPNRVAEGHYRVIRPGMMQVRHSDGVIHQREFAEGDNPHVIAGKEVDAYARKQNPPFWDPINYGSKPLV